MNTTFFTLWCAHKRLPTLRRVSDFSESRFPRSVRWVNDVSSNRTIFLYCSHIHAATSRCPINIQRCIDVPSSDAREIIVRESADSPTMSGRDPSDIYQIINCHYGCRKIIGRWHSGNRAMPVRYLWDVRTIPVRLPVSRPFLQRVHSYQFYSSIGRLPYDARQIIAGFPGGRR